MSASSCEWMTELRFRLLQARNEAGHWEGELSSSALATATAVCALALVDRESGAAEHHDLIVRGLDWLAAHQNEDGGWGDTVRSRSNISTTTLCFAVLHLDPIWRDRYAESFAGCTRWLTREAGGVAPQHLADAIYRRYGRDRTFAVPILTMAALCGALGPTDEAWARVVPLPFEIAALPQRLFRWVRMPVVSYALPALIAIGQVAWHHRKPRNPLTRMMRSALRRRTLGVLARIQPPNGGFLEATPLTAFVTMSLASSGQANERIATRGAEFLARSARDDGSWPIDTNLATWLTTLAVNALGAQGAAGSPETMGDCYMSMQERRRIVDWLMAQQVRSTHPYTGAAPGGWAWTDLPGGVPDADDTAGALLALRRLAAEDERVAHAARHGVAWLLGLQNSDGGIPTFCRGWGTLPFDRSSPDLTAHALRAICAWREALPAAFGKAADRGVMRATAYILAVQQHDGSWLPLWFGNEQHEEEANPVYGTTRVLLSLYAIPGYAMRRVREAREKAVRWLLAIQNEDGGWGGGYELPSSVEETAFVVEALAVCADSGADPALTADAEAAVARGVGRLAAFHAQGPPEPSPIGFYFARLWYFEALYPAVFAVAAMERVAMLPTLDGDLEVAAGPPGRPL